MQVRKATDARDFASVAHDIITLPQLKAGNYVSRKGYGILENVAARLLRELHISLRVSLGTARDALVESFAHDIEKRKRESFSAPAVIERTREALKSLELPSGAYVFAAQFSHSAKALKFHIGPVTIVSKARFYRENAAKLREGWPGSERSHSFLLKKWVEHLKAFDHVIIVNLQNYERDLGWVIARECAEFALNIVRTYFGFNHTKRIRLSADFALEQTQASLIFEESGLWLSHGTGGISSFLDNDLMEHFDQDLRSMAPLLASFVSWLASGRHLGSPTVERLRYANLLIAEAYCEPSNYLRLVRLISALEAMAVIRGMDKAHELAVRCASVGGWSECDTANEVYDAVRNAYHWRNMVVTVTPPPRLMCGRRSSSWSATLFGFLSAFSAFFPELNRR